MSNVVQFKPRAPEPEETTVEEHGGGGGGPQVIQIKIVLECAEDPEEAKEPIEVTPVKAGGFWTGVMVALTLLFMGVL